MISPKLLTPGFLVLLATIAVGHAEYSLAKTPQTLPKYQDVKLSELPAFEKVGAIRSARLSQKVGGRVQRMRWAADAKSVAFTVDGQRNQLMLGDYTIAEYEKTEEYKPPAQDRPKRRPRVGRALQRTIEVSPDETMKAVYRDFNVFIEPIKSDSEQKPIQVTDSGSERQRFGTCCWVYGEELDQSDAMWWSPDGKKLVFYEVNEDGMRDYYLTTKNDQTYTEILAVRYPKAGDTNPTVKLHVYDLESKTTRELKIEGDRTQYLFNIKFAPDGKHLLVNRTNRQQNVLDVLAVNVDSGEVKTVVQEKQETWQENAPTMRFLEDKQRFVWETERNGWRHFELRHIDGRLLNPLSEVGEYPCERIIKLDEENGWMYFSAYSDANPYNQQLHRVRLDGTDHQRISDSPLNHTSIEISPFHDVVIAVREQVDTPPETVVYSCSTGKQVATLATGTSGPADEIGLPSPELFSFMANDGETKIWGTLHKPSNFDPAKKYPLLIDVYGGPGSRGMSNRYQPANPYCELGFLIAKIGNRGTVGRGKAFESATYLNLGDRDLQDQADGVKFLAKREYVDQGRVGIYGHSYGGYMSALALLKHPQTFHVAVAGAPVTDWRQYDSIYTERYMQVPQTNGGGYDQGSCIKHAKNLQGRLLLVHGLIDDNVHPGNTWELAKSLQNADKRFDMMIYPGFKHGVGSTYNSVKWEYFCRHLLPSGSAVADDEAANDSESR